MIFKFLVTDVGREIECVGRTENILYISVEVNLHNQNYWYVIKLNGLHVSF